MSEDKAGDFLVSHVDKVKVEKIDRAEGMYKQWLMGDDVGAACCMRKFTMKEGGEMPMHRHENLYHLQYVLSGKIKMIIGDEEFEAKEGSFIFIPKGKPHSYENLSEGDSQFLCIIPAVEDGGTEILED